MKKVLSGFSILLLAASVCASPEDGGDWKERKEARMKEVREKLDLTPEQDKKLEAHRKAHWEEGKKLREEKRAKKDALRAALEDPAMDAGKVKALHEEVKQLEARISDHRLEGILAVRGILTPEQFKKFHDMHEKSKDGRGKGRKGRHGKD